MPSNVQDQAIVALYALGRTNQQIATAVGVEVGDVESVVGGSTFTPPGVPLSGGSGSPGSPIIRKFPFAFDTPGLLTGHTVYTPAVDEILFDAWFEIDTPWNGTTPFGDVGCFINGNNSGWFGSVLNEHVDMTVADVANAAAGWLPAELLSSPALPPPHSGSVSGLMAQVIFRAIASTNDFAPDRILPAKFAVSAPVKVVVAAGALGDPDPGSTQGAAILYLVTATPV